MTYYVMLPVFDGWRTDLSTTKLNYAKDRQYQLRLRGARIVNSRGDSVRGWQ